MSRGSTLSNVRGCFGWILQPHSCTLTAMQTVLPGPENKDREHHHRLGGCGRDAHKGPGQRLSWGFGRKLSQAEGGAGWGLKRAGGHWVFESKCCYQPGKKWRSIVYLMALLEIKNETYRCCLWTRYFLSCIIIIEAECYLRKLGGGQLFFYPVFFIWRTIIPGDILMLLSLYLWKKFLTCE